jgi:hypothetical protein
MVDVAEDRARVALRQMSRGLTGSADFRLEVALAITQLGKANFRAADVSAVLAGSTAGRSDNVVRNLKALVDAGLLKQRTVDATYERTENHPFWTFVADTWTLLLRPQR